MSGSKAAGSESAAKGAKEPGGQPGEGDSGTKKPAVQEKRPAVQEKRPVQERAGMVKVIVGTRRYHSTACPLIRGAGDTGVETMSLAQAEAAGLTSCSVCQNDRETVS